MSEWRRVYDDVFVPPGETWEIKSIIWPNGTVETYVKETDEDDA